MLYDAYTHLIGVVATGERAAVLVPTTMMSGVVTVAENDGQDDGIRTRELSGPRRPVIRQKPVSPESAVISGRNDDTINV